MSSSSSSNTPAPLPAHRLVRLSSILRAANARYARVAASKLGLALDIKKAVNCPERQVSVIPLPILDTAPSPAPSSAPRARPALTLVVRAPRPPRTSRTALLRAVQRRLALHWPRCGRRGADRPARAARPWLGPTSRFSVTRATPSSRSRQTTRSSHSRRAARRSARRARRAVRRGRRGVGARLPRIHGGGLRLIRAVVVVDRLVCVAVVVPHARVVSVPSGSSSNASSRGPSTPADTDPGVTLSAKRKSEDEDVVEKRPKYERKSWVTGSRRAPRKLF
ncbi:hypothetical protein B0H10DRAFT_2262054 [Mycena sp. CBHHK59/15]|nr:hypothetical protein B0H10DRAFT_2262054 [Mycena sp. CBHHK59/15]